MKYVNLLLSRPFIKINSCLIGYGLWIMLSQHQIITRTIQIPVCFYKTAGSQKIIAPETIQATIQSHKKNLQNFDVYNSALHIDASFLKIGNNQILLKKENLFLPDEIKLVNLLPSSLQIQLQNNE